MRNKIDMQIEKNEILFVYNPSDLLEREAYGYAKALKNFVIKEFDVLKDNFTQQQIVEISNRLNVSIKELIDDQYLERHKSIADFSDEDLLKYIQKNISILNTPIALYHDSAEFVKSPYNFIKKDLAIKGVKSIKANPVEIKTK